MVAGFRDPFKTMQLMAAKLQLPGRANSKIRSAEWILDQVNGDVLPKHGNL
jgi:hypothetical protein